MALDDVRVGELRAEQLPRLPKLRRVILDGPGGRRVFITVDHNVSPHDPEAVQVGIVMDSGTAVTMEAFGSMRVFEFLEALGLTPEYFRGSNH